MVSVVIVLYATDGTLKVRNFTVIEVTYKPETEPLGSFFAKRSFQAVFLFPVNRVFQEQRIFIC